MGLSSRLDGVRAGALTTGPEVALVFPLAWIGLAASALVALAGLTPPVEVRYAVLLGTVLVLGLPHGALDHLTVSRARGHAADARSLAAVGALYALLGGAYVLAWFVAPAASVLFFLVLTWYHWGTGDLYPAAVLGGGTHLSDPVCRWATGAVRGGIPMIVPLVAFPDRYAAVIETLLGLFGAAPTALSALFRPAVGTTLLAVLAMLGALSIARGWRRGHGRRGLAIDAFEIGFLAGYFAVVPPVVAIAVYFAVWHSLRHLVRLFALEDGETGATVRLLQFGRDLLPATLGAIAVLAGLALVLPVASTRELAGAYLVTLAALTVPHAVIVARLDALQGIAWTG